MSEKSAVWERKQLLNEVQDILLVGGTRERYLDMGLEVRVIEEDPKGTYTYFGNERDFKGNIVSVHRYGGRLDKLSSEFVGPPEKWVVMHAYPKQWEAISQYNKDSTLMLGGEGSGKTQTAVIWTLIQVLTHRNSEGGFTAPTQVRVNTFTNFLLAAVPPTWYRRRLKQGEIFWVNSVKIQCVSTTKRSHQAGSPLQGFTWSFVASDEIQDYEKAILDDIGMRGRGARGGHYSRMNTATPRDTYIWRNTLEELEGFADWSISTLIGPDNPFVPPEHWQKRLDELSDREYRRRVLAEKLPPEKAIYHAFSREKNVIPLPFPPPQPVTRNIAKHDFVIGFDPGVRQNVCVLLQAFPIKEERRHVSPGDRKKRGFSWWVMDELYTRHTTVQEHGLQMVQWLRDKGCFGGGKTAIVLVDPADQIDERTSDSILSVLRNLGLKATRAVTKTRINKEDRIQMLNNLFESARGDNYLFIERRNGECKAPYLLESLESALRDDFYQAEKGRKRDDDHSHAPSALSYGIWRYEPHTSGTIKYL